MAVLTAGTVAAWDCDKVRAAYFDRSLPAGVTWPRPGASESQKVTALRAVLAGLGGNTAAPNPLQALADVAGFTSAAAIAAMIDAGATAAVALALYRRVTSNTAHGAGDCHQSPSDVIVEPVTGALGDAMSAAGKIALTLVFVLIGGAMVLLGLRQLGAPLRSPKASE